MRSNGRSTCNSLFVTRQHTRTRRVDLRSVHPNGILVELEGVLNSFFESCAWQSSLASHMGQWEGRAASTMLPTHELQRQEACWSIDGGRVVLGFDGAPQRRCQRDQIGWRFFVRFRQPVPQNRGGHQPNACLDAYCFAVVGN